MIEFLKYIAVVVFILGSNFVNAQDLASVDKRKRDAMVKELDLNELQVTMIDTVFFQYSRQLNELDAQIQDIETSGEFAEEDVVVRVSVMQQEKKDLREVRELDLKMLLRPEQAVIYDEKIRPSKPQVLHFGIHNRADCNVCKK
ncbi:MAG: hypothetical protein ACJAU0_002092 [Flavobacteriales bacterium]|jgi:hypothetical protein